MGATRTVRIVYETNAKQSLGEADKSTQGLGSSSAKAQTEIAKLNAQFARTAGSLDPHIAAHNRYSQSIGVLNQALSKGVVTQAEHARLLDFAKTKYEESGQKVSQFSSLLSKLTELTSLAGPAASEAAEKLGMIGEKVAGVGELGESLGALLGPLAAIAAAVAVLGIAWKIFEEGFDFLKEAVEEGAKFEVVIAKLNSTLAANGSSAGLSAREMIEFAESLSLATARPTAEILKGLTVLTQFQRVGHDTFQRASKDILDYAQQVGVAPEQAFEKFGRALEGGQRGLRALEEIGGVFNRGQKEYLRQLIENGRVTEYQSLLLSVLEGHVKGAAAAFEHTLIGQVTQAKNALTSFKESIASSVIPALEYVISTVLGSTGSWETLRKDVQSEGEKIGDSVARMVYGIEIYFHQWQKDLYDLDTVLIQVYGSIYSTQVKFQSKYYSLLSNIPGATGKAYSIAAKETEKAAAALSVIFDKAVISAQKAAQAQEKEITRIRELIAHPPHALTGSDEKPGPANNIDDSVIQKKKELESIYAELNKVVQTYDDKLEDQTRKLGLNKDAKEALLVAARQGLYEYALEQDAQARLAAVTSQTLALDKEHRTEIEALTAAETKLRNAGKISQAKAVGEEIRQLNKDYTEQRAKIAGLANDVYTLGTNTDRTNGFKREEQSLLEQERKVQAALEDALTGTSDATRKLSQELASEHDNLSLLSQDEKDRLARLRETNAETERLVELQKLITGVHQEADFKVQVAGIDSDLSASTKAVETHFLELLRTAGKGSVEEGVKLVKELAEKSGKSFSDVVKEIKKDLGVIEEARLALSLSGISKSNLKVYQEEQNAIQKVVDDGLLSVEDGTAAMSRNSAAFWSNTVSIWSSALQTLGSVTGGFIAKLAQAAQALQTSQSVSSGVSSGVSSLGGSAALSGGLGAIAGEVYLVYAIKSFFEAQWAEEASRRFGAVGEFIVANGKEWITQLDQNGAESIKAIRQVVENFGQAIGGTVTDLAKIGIQVRNDGKAFAAYVEDKFLGYFTSANDAIKAAVLYALQDPKSSIRGISELVKQGLANFRGSATEDLDYLAQFLGKLKKISDLGKTSDQTGAEAALLDIEGLRDALLKVHDVTPAVIKGFVDIAQAGDDVFNNWRDSITGTQRTAYEIFEKNKLAFDSEVDSRRLSIEAQIADTKARLAAAGAVIATTQQIVGALVSLSAAASLPGSDSPSGLRNYNGGQGPTGFNGGGGGGTGQGAGGGNGYSPRDNPPPIAGGGPKSGGDSAEVQALKALLASLIAELAGLPTKIQESEFRNQNAPNFYALQVDDAVQSFKRVSDALASANETADQFSSDLSSALANVATSFADTRDAITGHTRSAAEELAIKQQQAALFNVELPLEIANLKAEVAKDEALLASAGVTNTYAAVVLDSAKAVAANAQITAQATALTGQLSAAEIEATKRKIDALNGVIAVLQNVPLIDPNTIRVSTGSGGKTPAQELADFFAAFKRGQLPQLSQEMYDINKKFDDEIKLHSKDKDAIAELNRERQIEIDKAKEQARQAQVGSAQQFIDSPLPDLVHQVNGVHTAAQGLIDGLRSLHDQGGLTTKQLHDLVAAIRASEQAQIQAIKAGILAQIDQFSGALANQGLTGELKSISDQSKSLRDSLNALAEAGTLTADEFIRSATKITEAAHAQEQAKFNSAASGLLGELYGYLHNDVASAKLKYSLTLLDLQARYAELQAAAEIYGLSNTYFNEIGDALDQFKKAGFQQFLSSAQSAGQSQLDAAQAQQQAAAENLAAANKLTEWQQSLYTNPETSPVSARKQVEFARAQLDTLIGQAEGGDKTARDRFTTQADAFLSLYRTAFGKTGEYARNVAELSEVADILKVQLTGNPGQNLAIGQFGQSPGQLPVDLALQYQGYVSPNAPAGLGTTVDYSSDKMPTAVNNIAAAVTDSQVKTLNSLSTISQNLSQTGDLYKISQSIGIDASKFYSSALDRYGKIIDTLSDILEEMRKLNSSAQRKQAA